ncbi:MAG: S41 family peptidase [Pseudomonadota bacterium]
MFDLALVNLLPSQLCLLEIETLNEAAGRIEAAYVLELEAAETSNRLTMLASEITLKDECQQSDAFAQVLTQSLRDISGDGHFYVEVTNDDSSDDWIPAWRASGYKRGQGIRSVEVLENNIGYIRIQSFFELEPAYQHYRGAFDMVADTDALILDLRDNHGGSSQTTWPVQWTFLEPGTPTPMMMESRIKAAETREEPAVLWRRYGADRPLAILIDANTFSAPEAVAYTLQLQGRATIVGEPSGGGAHMLDEGERLSTGFTLYTPTTRPISVATGENWEGKGVLPDIVVPSQSAREKAIEVLSQKIIHSEGSIGN